ncbi:unnamed protein product [Rodentolepis nana]|uniref:non-specific serine/threonine protein kinase n=1 Tax=Rodentolepis nana TaxID=102285 RepID=A0A0R3TYH9_RODNA|nr:unnamed protein product [Rodentolepis nana]
MRRPLDLNKQHTHSHHQLQQQPISHQFPQSNASSGGQGQGYPRNNNGTPTRQPAIRSQPQLSPLVSQPMGLLNLLKQARLNPTANGLMGLKRAQRGVPVRAKSNPSVTTGDNKWFGSAPKSEDAKQKAEKLSQSSGSLSSGSSSDDDDDGDGKTTIPEDCRSESAFFLRPPPGPKLKRRLAKPRPDEIFLVDELYDDSEAFNTDDGEVERTAGEKHDLNTSTRLTEVLQLQAVCLDVVPAAAIYVLLFSTVTAMQSYLLELDRLAAQLTDMGARTPLSATKAINGNGKVTGGGGKASTPTPPSSPSTVSSTHSSNSSSASTPDEEGSLKKNRRRQGAFRGNGDGDNRRQTVVEKVPGAAEIHSDDGEDEIEGVNQEEMMDDEEIQLKDPNADDEGDDSDGVVDVVEDVEGEPGALDVEETAHVRSTLSILRPSRKEDLAASENGNGGDKLIRRIEAPPLPHRDDSSSPPPLPPRCQPPCDPSINGGDPFGTPVACFPIIATSNTSPNATTACVNGLQLQLVSCFPPELLMEVDPVVRHQFGLPQIRRSAKKANRRYSAPPGYLVPMLSEIVNEAEDVETIQRSVQRRPQPPGHYNHLAQQNQRPSSVIYTGTSGDLWASQEESQVTNFGAVNSSSSNQAPNHRPQASTASAGLPTSAAAVGAQQQQQQQQQLQQHRRSQDDTNRAGALGAASRCLAGSGALPQSPSFNSRVNLPSSASPIPNEQQQQQQQQQQDAESNNASGKKPSRKRGDRKLVSVLTDATMSNSTFPGHGEAHWMNVLNKIAPKRQGSQQQHLPTTVEVSPALPLNQQHEETPEVHVYKKRFSSEILCAAMWGVNLLIGLDTGLSLLDRSGEGKVYSLISRRRFSQMAVLEGQNILVTISGRKNRLRVYYLSWLKSKIMKSEGCDKKNGWVNVGENLHGAVTFKIVKHENIKFLVIALRDSVEIYAWAPRPYHKFMAFKHFSSLHFRPLLVDLTVEENQRLKVIYGSEAGFHAIDLDTNTVFDLYLCPKPNRGTITPHCIVVLPNTDGLQLLLCYDTEGVYVDTSGKMTKNVIIQWGETPTSVAYIAASGQLLGWGLRAIEVRSAATGHLDGVFMHKREQRFKFLCERNDKVFFSNTRSGSPQVSMMTLSGIHW